MPAPAATPGTSEDPRLIPVYFSLVVWGKAYVGMFLDFCLPSLLAPNNIPAIRHRAGSKFVLHTQASDLPALERSAAFGRLKEIIEVDVRLMRSDGMVPHDALSRCHRETMESGDERGIPVVFLSPDTIWSDGSIASVDRILTTGKRVIFLPPSVRLVKEGGEPVLRKLFASRQSVELSLSARELIKVATDFLHPTMDEYFFEPGRGNALAPMMLLWAAPNGDMLGHAFHQHPLM